ncbi:MAG TPA: TonB-dependent receptor [Candidatus Angelobacter sp.]
MNTRLRYFAVVFAVALALAWCIPSVGQVLKGSISGTAVDPQGAVVSGAQVSAKNIDTGVVYPTTTDSSGLFRLNLLPVGTYNVSITGKGFKTSESKGVAVGPGTDSGLGSIHLSVGETSTTVEVNATAPLIDTTQAQVTNTFSGTTLSGFAGIQENEGLDRLALFVPGVVATRSDNFSNTNGVGFSSNGLRGRNNDQEVDGQNNNDNSVGGPGLFVSNPEFVGQYVIVTNNFGPEYGRNSGSVVNVITKGGSNAWHGAIFGEENNSYLNALSNTQKNTNKPGGAPCAVGSSLICNPFTGPPRSNNEFSGGTIGGPILKNKAFIFGGFDNQLISANSVFTTASTTPTPAGLATLAACAGINTTALSVLQNFGPYAFGFGNPTPRSPTTSTFAIPGVPTGCPNVQTGGVTRVVGTPFHGFDWVVRPDFQIGGDSFSARYIFNRGNSFVNNDNAAAGWVYNVPALSQAVLLSWTHNFSSRMVNEARLSFGRLNVEFGGGLNSLEPVSGNLANAFTNITFQGGGLGIGPATNLPQARLVNTWQAQDNWNYVLGKHSLKAGVNWTYQRSPNTFLPDINGAYRFTSLDQFLFGTATTPADVANRIIVANGQPTLDFREYDTFLYAGDDWKISQNLTLNLGITWTYYGSPADLFNQVTTTRENQTNITPGCVAAGTCAFWLQSLPLSVRTDPSVPAVMNSFGPSVGFAYSPQWGGFITGHGKTTIRGGYRLLYDPPFYNIFLNESTSSPQTFLQTITTGLNAFPMPGTPTGPNVRNALGAALLPNTFDPRTQNETNITPNFGPDKVHTWSAGFEREMSKNSALEVRYVGNKGTNLFQTVDGNPYLGTAAKPGLLQTFPQLIPNGSSLTPCAATQQVGVLPATGPTDVGREQCGFGVLRTRNNGGYSSYEGLQVEFRANNMAKQLTMRTGFTWSKTMDNVSEIFSTGTAGNTVFASQNPFNTTSGEYAISGLNIPKTWSLLFVEQLPFFREQHGFMGHVLGGWSISADYLLASGQPYNAQQGAIFGAIAQFTTCGSTGAVCTGTNPNYYDGGYASAFSGEAARPFFGNVNAPANTVGIMAGDACSFFGNIGGVCALPATQLISFNALNAQIGPTNGPGTLGCLRGVGTCPLVTVTNNDVKFIINGKAAQSVFGTPFGNVPRNVQTDAISNIVNLSVYKNFRLGEHATFEMHATALNAFNHFNFSSIDPNVEDAGLQNSFGSGFANPATTSANGRTLYVGGVIRF